MNKELIVNALICIVLFLFVILDSSSKGFAFDKKAEVKRSIVKIKVYKPGNVIETGTGIILSTSRQMVSILTAYHVVEEAERISVKFFGHPTEDYGARLFERYDEDSDVAVVYIRTLRIPRNIFRLQLGDPSKINELDKVIAIGHPSSHEWEFSTGEVRSPELSQFRVSGDAVDPGNSGGALLNEQFQLIGLLTKESHRDGIALKIDHVLEILKRWKISSDFKRDSKKWPWIVAAGVAGGIATGLIVLAGDGTVAFPDPPGRPGGN